MMRLILDFDGPIMDISDRYYHVYQLCLKSVKLPEQKLNELSKEEFWRLKRAKISEKEIGILSGLSAEQAVNFSKQRNQTVHTLPYLPLDKIVPGAIETLEKWQKKGYDLVVMTMRLQKELDFALESYNLGGFFAENKRYCLPNDYQKVADIQDKPILMGKAVQELPKIEKTWMIGDKEADIVAAKNHNINIISVLSGIRDRPSLEEYQPDYIVNDISEADLLIN